MRAPVEDAAYERLKASLLDQIKAVSSSVDAVYLPLHGAMTTAGCEDVEGDLAQAVRNVIGPATGLVVSFDLHGAPTQPLLDACDALVGYKTCPHVDFEETGRRALRLAVRALQSGQRLTTKRHVVPLLTPAEVHDTTIGPVAPLVAAAQVLGRTADVQDVSVFMCQPWLDTARSSWVVTAVSTVGQSSVAESVARQVAGSLWEARDTFNFSKLTVPAAMGTLGRSPKGDVPYLLADSGDSPSAGSTGDSTDLLEGLVALDPPGRIFATIADPNGARALSQSRPGSHIKLTVGGAFTPGLSRPLAIEGTLSWLGNGQYRSRYPAGPVDVGAVGVVDVGKCAVVVTERPAMMLDPALYLHVGLDPRTAFAVQVKSAGGFRALLAPISDRILVLATRGASDGDLKRLPFAHRPRPVWPFEPDAQFV